MFLMQEAQNIGITDNQVLDQWRVPFGDWMEQSVFWITNNLSWLLDSIKWPFHFLISRLVGDVLEPISWVWVVLAFFVIGTLARNLKVGVFSAVALSLCGILGNAYWVQTARTIGFIAVAVILCVIIGIPIGILCGRSDAVWQVVRPMLDAMQVVHSFVYMLPFIFFWHIGEESATMVTMVYALPPLVRLTNLGIRQVPEDVVEASRAYGAPEWRVLTDVQLPLARPAIMTGLNQTLLLSISMLGIAALMGAGGLGQLLLRAMSGQDVAKGASAGLAFFLVAVVLDRISQPEASDGESVGSRLMAAWSNRRTPERLLVDNEPDTTKSDSDDGSLGAPAEVTTDESNRMRLAAIGSAVVVISMFLSWSVDGGKISSFGRSADNALPGESFNGFSASGGSWFALISLGLALFVLAAVAVTWKSPGNGPRWLTADGAVLASIAMSIVTLGYLLMSTSTGAEGVSSGIGAYIALAGSLVAATGAVSWVRIAPAEPLHPLRKGVHWAQVALVAFALLVMFISSISGWSFDQRGEIVMSDEVQQQLADLKQQAIDNPQDAGVIASQVSILQSSQQAQEMIINDGITPDGPRLGIWEMAAAILALAVALPAAGLLGRDERTLWLWNSAAAGIGAGATLVSAAWIASLTRSADANYVSGMGSFLAFIGGTLIVVSTMSVLREFQRETIYPEPLAALPSEQRPHQDSANRRVSSEPASI